MDAIRTEKISVNLTPDLLTRLDQFAAENRWTRSTAAAVLIERACDGRPYERHVPQNTIICEALSERLAGLEAEAPQVPGGR